MRLNTSQQLRLSQEMKLSPRIIQAMEILQLPSMALLERIDSELQSNPVLELHDPGVDDEAPMQRDDEPLDRGEQALIVRDEHSHTEDFQRLHEFVDEYGPESIGTDYPAPSRASGDGERDRKLDAMANTPAPEQGLTEHLLEQWSFADVPEELRIPGEIIIHRIDDDGYLRSSLEELAAEANGQGSVQLLGQALKLVQTLDPPGIAARDLRECLQIQLQAEAAAGADVTLQAELVRRYLPDIEKNRLPHIAQRTGRTIEEIKDALEALSHLNPRPGRLVSRHVVPSITPDAVVELDDEGELIVWLPDGDMPQLKISRAYRKLARDRSTDGDARQFLRRNIRSAQWLIAAVEQRRETVRRVTFEVFSVQRDFLTHGEEALKPLPMADVAARVGVHVATVSRAVAGKYVQTPRGIYPLRMFFSGGTTTSSGEDVSWDAVKVRLREVIEAEDKSNPLSDDQLAEELGRGGIQIARRTIAKYRGMMNIPSARQRRQY